MVTIHVVSGRTPHILSHKDMDEMNLNYQLLYKVTERPDDGYRELVGMRKKIFRF